MRLTGPGWRLLSWKGLSALVIALAVSLAGTGYAAQAQPAKKSSDRQVDEVDGIEIDASRSRPPRPHLL